MDFRNNLGLADRVGWQFFKPDLADDATVVVEVEIILMQWATGIIETVVSDHGYLSANLSARGNFELKWRISPDMTP